MSEHRDFHVPAACAAIDELLEPYVDGELNAAARARIDRHLASCPACAEQLELARRVGAGLRALPPQSCPPRVTRAVLAQAERAAQSGGFWRRLLPAPPPRWRPALALLLLAALSFAVLRRPPATPPPVPAADVAQAEEEVKLALAYLGRIGAQAGTAVRKEVFAERLATPLARSFRGALAPGDEPPEEDR
ncbi:MAG: hypothetical protein D6696_17675 [Acidobacteria bacterium]|nr:MAG: hypothetical protein D6696_17675 [Acidobacteriota bacterium]